MEGGKVDGRTLRKTGRVVQLATRVTEEIRDRLDAVTIRDRPPGHRRKMVAELLEEALEAYERERASRIMGEAGTGLEGLQRAWGRASDGERVEFAVFVGGWLRERGLG